MSLLIDAVKQSMQCIRDLYGEITLALTETNTMAALIHKTMHRAESSLVRYVILAISIAKIDFIVFMASLGIK